MLADETQTIFDNWVRQPSEVHANSYCEGLLAQIAFAFGSLHVDIHSFWGSGEQGEGQGQKLRVQRDRIAVWRREGEGVHTSLHVINWRSRHTSHVCLHSSKTKPP